MNSRTKIVSALSLSPQGWTQKVLVNTFRMRKCQHSQVKAEETYLYLKAEVLLMERKTLENTLKLQKKEEARCFQRLGETARRGKMGNLEGNEENLGMATEMCHGEE